MMLFSGQPVTESPRTTGVSHRHGGSSCSRTDSPTAIRITLPLSAIVSTPLAGRGEPVDRGVDGSVVGGRLVGDGSLDPGLDGGGGGGGGVPATEPAAPA